MPTNSDPRFTVSYDAVTKILSGILCALMLAAMLAVHNLFVGAFLILVLFVGFAYSPRGYIVADRAVIVQRLVGDVRVPVENARELRRVAPEDLRGCIRLWGSGGLFGYYGLFRTSKLGKCTWYATDRKKLIVLIGESKTTIYSPDDVDGFMAAVREQAPVPIQPASGSAVEVPASVSKGRTLGARIVVGLAIFIAGFGILAAFFAMRYSPGLPRYTLTRDALTIQDRFYPVTLRAGSVDLGGVRVIDLDTNPEWVPSIRTNGFSNTHYHSGWYRLRNGMTVRLYRAGGDRLVYLPSSRGDAPVLLETADPDRFLGQIEAEWQYPQ